jgi:hypothetical protein
MRPWTRGLASMLVAAALLAVGASCTSNDSIVGPSAEPSQQPTTPALHEPTPDPLLEPLVDPALQLTLKTVHLLTCSRQPYAQTKAAVGPAGGTIVVGAHRLTIPAGALSSPVTITAEQMSGVVNSVRLQPAGLKFAKAATLTLSYSNCLLPPLTKRVVYTDEQLRILELIPSLDLRLSKSVNGSILHFSRYAVAY